mmetsp:Transcript_117955/g.334490  ORF Transcript_117955/g.334490 Transcript_117955/m.334490 type:complete len:555 (+) Transcript_117955:140-1804(+)
MAPGAPRAFGLGVLLGALVCAGCVAAVLLLCPGTPGRTQSHITRFQAGNLLLPKPAHVGLGHGLSARAHPVRQVYSQHSPARGIRMVAESEEDSQWGRHVLELGRAPGPVARGGAGVPAGGEAAARGVLGALVDYEAELRALARRDVPGLEEKLGRLRVQVRAAAAALAVALAPQAAHAAGNVAVDKTGFIGGVASVIENGIDFGHEALLKTGMENTYGLSIVLFTVLVKFLTLPLITTQIESSTQMQKLQPLQKQVQELFPDDKNERQVQEKNQYMAQLFSASGVNPLAALLPAFAQIPVFISLYRALQNLEAEGKLSEPFLWLPNLEGPVYNSKPGETFKWFTSLIFLNPQLGYEQSADYLSIPLILFLAQRLGQKLMAPPRDPSKPMTEQEQMSQSIINNLPFLTAFFSINVPSGLGIYWVANSVLTTLVTVATKQVYADRTLPPEVDDVMRMIDARRAQLTPRNAKIVLPKKGLGSMAPKGLAVSTAPKGMDVSTAPKATPSSAEPTSAPIELAPEAMAASEAAGANTSMTESKSAKKKKAAAKRKRKSR